MRGVILLVLLALALGYAVVVWSDRQARASFGYCQMKTIEHDIPKVRLNAYLDACMQSEGYERKIGACWSYINRVPSCYAKADIAAIKAILSRS